MPRQFNGVVYYRITWIFHKSESFPTVPHPALFNVWHENRNMSAMVAFSWTKQSRTRNIYIYEITIHKPLLDRFSGIIYSRLSMLMPCFTWQCYCRILHAESKPSSILSILYIVSSFSTTHSLPLFYLYLFKENQ